MRVRHSEVEFGFVCCTNGTGCAHYESASSFAELKTSGKKLPKSRSTCRLHCHSECVCKPSKHTYPILSLAYLPIRLFVYQWAFDPSDRNILPKCFGISHHHHTHTVHSLDNDFRLTCSRRQLCATSSSIVQSLLLCAASFSGTFEHPAPDIIRLMGYASLDAAIRLVCSPTSTIIDKDDDSRASFTFIVTITKSWCVCVYSLFDVPNGGVVFGLAIVIGVCVAYVGSGGFVSIGEKKRQCRRRRRHLPPTNEMEIICMD